MPSTICSRYLFLFLLLLLVNSCDAVEFQKDFWNTKLSDQEIYYAGVVIIMFLVLISIIACLLLKIRKLKMENKKLRGPIAMEDGIQKRWAPLSNGQTDSLLSSESLYHLDLDQKFRINRNNLECDNVIDTLNLSILQKGLLKSPLDISSEKIDVLIKSPLNLGDPHQAMIMKMEIKSLCKLERHPNILTYIGFTEIRGVLSIITEYPEAGSLLHFIQQFVSSGGVLHKIGDCFGLNAYKNKLSISKIKYNSYRSRLDSKLSTLSTFDLLSFAYQIAKAMQFLADKSCCHRQLCLQTVYLTANKTIRIGNFGLARLNGNNDNYRTVSAWEIPESHRAPETYEEKRFSEKSDVYSYGVCLYELFSLGKTPYEGEKNVKKLVMSGAQLQMPDYCTHEVYILMRRCFSINCCDRPTFSECVEFLKNHFEFCDLKILKGLKEKLKAVEMYQESLKEFMKKDVVDGK